MAKILTSNGVRHLVFRLGPQDGLPEALTSVMRDAGVITGWIRAGGVLTDVDLRSYGAEIGGPAAERRIAGPVQVVSLEGSVGLVDGETSVGMRAVLARESDSGMEALAGEIVTARVVALEVVVTAFDDLAISRALDADAAVWLFSEGGTAAAAPARNAAPLAETVRGAKAVPDAGAVWPDAIQASSAPAAQPPKPPPTAATRYNMASPPGQAVMPQRIRPPPGVFADDGPFPEAGDVVEHFAFGTCEVVKSDGDRLHLRVKDGRIKEIALEMLRVTLLTTDGETRRYKLDRRL